MFCKKIISKATAISLASLLALSMAGCGGTATDGDTDTDTGETITTDDAQEVSAAQSALSGGLSSAGSSVASENAAELIKSSMKARMLTRYTEMTETLSETIECPTSGSVTLDGSLTISTDDDTSFSIDGDMTQTLDECTEDYTVTLSDGDCSFEGTVDGEMTCEITGSFTEAAGADIEFSCGTAEDCSGITMTVNGEEHTFGMSMTASMTGDISEGSEPEFTGTICVDGTEFSMDDFDSTEFSSDDFTCE